MNRVDKPHICFVAPDTWPVLANDRIAPTAGGAQVQQSLVAKSLARRGFRVSMICMDYGQPDRSVVDGVTVFKCHAPVHGLPLIRFFHPRLTGMWSALQRVDADIYYQRCAAALTGVTALFSKQNRRRFVFAAACDLDLARDQTWRLFQRRGGWRDRQLFHLGLKLADGVLAQHEGQVRDCEQWYGRQATAVTNCYDVPRGHRADANGVVLWVSALRTGKRPELFLELARRLPHLRFRMVGGPSAETEGAAIFERIRQDARGIPNLEFVGFVPVAEIDEHFNAARVFVNTSDFEGFPNTFLQSWSRGIPTVSFCDTGSRFHGEPVVTVASDLNDMTVLVDRLMHENVFWHTSGSRASSCYEKFHTPDAVMDSYERVFTGLWQSQPETRSANRLAGFESIAMPVSDHGKGPN